MKSLVINNATQNQRALYQNNRLGLTTNQFQAPINNFNQIIPQYSPQPPIPSGYNQINMILRHINPLNIRVPKPNQKVNQPQLLNQNAQNMKNNQSSMINANISYTRQNQMQGKFNQVNNSNNIIQGINQINLGNDLNESRIINNLIRNSMNRKNEAMNGHPPIPMKLSIEAMKSICKISYHYNNKRIFGTGFFMKYSDSLKLLITNYHVIYPELININIEIEIWNNEKMILNLIGR